MGAHIFLVGENNFGICLKHGVYGCVMPSKEWNKAEIIAGIMSIQLGDLVFFYVKNQGVYGLWKVSDENQTFPYRFTFDSVVGHFPKPISLSDILDLHDKGRIWTFDLNPVQQKNQYKITLDEARELIRLLLRNNQIRENFHPIPDPYIPTTRDIVDIDLESNHSGQVSYEGWLNAWFMRSLNRGELKALLGDYHEYLNLVHTTFNKVMDIFLTHVTTIGSIDILYKYTCIELKTEGTSEKDLAQILRYEDWLARKLAGGDKDMIQSILVARRYTDGVIDYVSKRQRIEEKTVRLITYQVSQDKQNILLDELRL